MSRAALYEEVWTDAVTVVAPRYGLSDAGLVKICKKLGNAVPSRGYCAKVKAGRPTRKLPLPALPAGARDLSGPIPLIEQEATMHARLRDALQQTRERLDRSARSSQRHRARCPGAGAPLPPTAPCCVR